MGAYLLGVIIYLLVFSLFEIFGSKRWALGRITLSAAVWPLSLIGLVILGYTLGLSLRDAKESK